MPNDDGDFVASWSLNMDEVGVGALQQAFLLVLLLFWGQVEEVLCERHVLTGRSSLLESLDLKDIYGTLHSTTVDCTVFSNTYGIFSVIDHMCSHKTILNTLKKH